MLRISVLFLLLFPAAWFFLPGKDRAEQRSAGPVLIELFTSEGCSSCPPADALLQELDKTQPVNGARVVVLSEHVDYWNHLGWRDPYSSRFFTDRQESYVRHFGLASPYTPQIVVDGTTQFVGNDLQQAGQAIEKARQGEEVPVLLSSVSWESPFMLRAHVDAGSLSELPPANADVFFAVALDHAESQVLRGENEGRRLHHVAVILSLTRIGTAEKGKSFAKDVRIKLDRNYDPENLRAIAFLQEPGPGACSGRICST